MAQFTFDPLHTKAEFSIKHMMFATVRGSMADVQGTIEYDADNIAGSRVEVTLGVASINTNNTDRDTHLRSADFFDVETYPNITFKSTSVEDLGNNRARITGDLTIKDVTREVSIEAELLGSGVNPWGQEVTGFSGTVTINREDWGLKWNQALEAGGWLVGRDANITLDVQAVRVTEAAPSGD